jgi:hypothetical protein
MSILHYTILSLLMFNTSVLAVEVVNVDVKRKPYDKTWKSRETTIVGKAQRVLSGEVNGYGGEGASVYEKTGFFHVRKVNDAWVIVDPDGSPFISKGINSIRMGKTAASLSAFADKFGNEDRWSEKTLVDLKALGFNTIGSWSDWQRLRKADARIPYTIMWNFMSSYGRKVGGVYQQSGHVGYPNGCIYVFDKAFEGFCDEYAQQMFELKDDPYLLGHFSDNEMPLRPDMLDRYLTLDKTEEGYLEAVAWLKAKGVTPASIADETRDAFVEYVAEKYFSIVRQAIRKHDPNHMYLGCRFHGKALNMKPLFNAAAGHLDIISINWYWQWIPDNEKMEHWKQWSGRPFIITEFYAKGMDSGMGNTSGAGWVVKTQRERGYFYQNFTLGLLKHPNCVGWHWHRYMDNDPDAGEDPSNVDSNKGIVTCQYEPHEDLLVEMNRMNRAVTHLRTGMLRTKSSVNNK